MLSEKSDAVSQSGSQASVEAKLPKLELPLFDGEPTDWTSFWDQFAAIVDSSDLPDVTKFTYLIGMIGLQIYKEGRSILI